METITQTNRLKPSLLTQALETLTDVKQPTFIWGPPGVGKSQIVAQLARARGLELRDVRAVLLDPVDLRGLPTIDKGRAKWATPDFLPRDGAGVLFLDELNAAPQLVQAACYQLILDRKLGEYVLPDNWCIIAAGNRDTDRAVTSRMPSALANRFVHLEFAVDIDDWSAWAMQNDLAPEVVAFMRFRPELLHQFDPTRAEKSFPTPRSWEFVARIVASKPLPELEHALIAGTVGEGAAAELVGFLRLFRELPSIDGILLNPDTASIPEAPAGLYAVSTALAGRATKDNIDVITRYMARLPEEFGVLLIKLAVQKTPDIQHTKAFVKWASANAHLLA